MDLAKAVAYAAVEGASQVLPISASGHRMAAALWLGDGEAGASAARLAQIGCAAALVVALRSRLGQAFAEGIRGIARPAARESKSAVRDATALATGSIVAVAVEVALEPLHIADNATPLAAALGMLVTAVSILSVSLAPAPRHVCPTALGAALVGVAHGLAVVPGASRVGAAFVVLSWLGVGRWHAVEMAWLVTIPSLAIGAVRWLVQGGGSTGAGTLASGEAALAMMVGFAAAGLAASWWRSAAPAAEPAGAAPMGPGRTAWLGLYLVPLALALVGYGRALPHP